MSRKKAKKKGLTTMTEGFNWFSTGEVQRQLKITRVTIYRWIEKGILVASPYTKGKRIFYWFDPQTIERIKRILPPLKDRKRGRILDDLLEEKLLS